MAGIIAAHMANKVSRLGPGRVSVSCECGAMRTSGDLPTEVMTAHVAEELTKAGFGNVQEALLAAADEMPIETLLGADKASVWLRQRGHAVHARKGGALLFDGGEHPAAEPGSDEQKACGQPDPNGSLRHVALPQDEANEHAGDKQQDEADAHESGSGTAGLGAGVPHVSHGDESTGQRETDLRPYLQMIDELTVPVLGRLEEEKQ